MSQSTGRPCKTGYLFKKGRGINLAIFKPWSYRWFSLDLGSGILKYYEEIEGRRILKGEVDVSIGHVVEHDRKINGRGNCMEILCNRINKNDHVTRSNSLEVLMLSAVYKSQLKDWKDAFLSLNEKNRHIPEKKPERTEKEKGVEKKPIAITGTAVASSASLPVTPEEPVAESGAELRKAAQMKALNAAMAQAKSLSSSPEVVSKSLNSSMAAATSPPAVAVMASRPPQENTSASRNRPNSTDRSSTAIASHSDEISTRNMESPGHYKAVESADDYQSDNDDVSCGGVLDLDMLLDESDAEEIAPVDVSSVHSSNLPRPHEPSVSPTGKDPPVFVDNAHGKEKRDQPQLQSQSNLVREQVKVLRSDPLAENRGKANMPPMIMIDDEEAKRTQHGVRDGEKIGCLFKRGRGRSVTFVKPWAYRWCTLNVSTGRLNYYVEENGRRAWKGALNTRDGTVFELDGKLVGKQCAFDICCMKRDFSSSKEGIIVHETVTFAAQYRSELEDWMYALSLVPGCEIVKLESGSLISDMFSLNQRVSEMQTGPQLDISPNPYEEAGTETALAPRPFDGVIAHQASERSTPKIKGTKHSQQLKPEYVDSKPARTPSHINSETAPLKANVDQVTTSHRQETAAAEYPSYFYNEPKHLSSTEDNNRPESALHRSSPANVGSAEAMERIQTITTATLLSSHPTGVETSLMEPTADYVSMTVGSAKPISEPILPTKSAASAESIPGGRTKGNTDRAVTATAGHAPVMEEEVASIPLPKLSRSANASFVSITEQSDDDDGYFYPDTQDEGQDENDDMLWGMAGGQAIVELLTEENDRLKRENEVTKNQLAAKCEECDKLQQVIANMSASNDEEMLSRDQMAQAQIAAVSELVSDLQSKLFAAQEEAMLLRNSATSRRHEITSIMQAEAKALTAEEERIKQAEEEVIKEIERNVLLLMASDIEEPLPLLPYRLWARGPLLDEAVEAVLAADPLKRPLVFLSDRPLLRQVPSSAATSGKSTLASMVCRSEIIKKSFRDNIFWLHVGDVGNSFANANSQQDFDHCALLEILADKIRKRLCPWLVRKLKKSTMSARDWRLYISDLLHSRKESISTSETIQNGVENVPSFGRYLLVLDDVRHLSVVSALGFLNMTTIVTSRTCWDLNQVSSTVYVDCPTTSEITGCPTVAEDKALPTKHRPQLSSTTSSHISEAAISATEGERTCALQSAISGFAVPHSPVHVNIQSANPKIHVSRISANLSSAFLKLSQEDQYRLISLSSLPSDTAFPYQVAAAMWDLDNYKARNFLYVLFTNSWIALTSPGDGFVVHSVCTEFLLGQLERLPVLARQHLKDKSLEATVKWLTSAEAFSAVLLRHFFDWSYISMWVRLASLEMIGKFQEQFMDSTRNMKYLSASDRLRILYSWDYACSLILRIPTEAEENRGWCEDWIRKSLQLKMELLSEKSIGSDLYVFRDIFAVLLDCNPRNMVYADAISYLQHMTSFQKLVDSKSSTTATPSFASAELLTFQACFHSAAGRVHRARELFKDASAILRDRISAPGSAIFLDSILVSQVLCKLKQVNSADSISSDVADDFGIVNEMLDEAMSERKVFLECDDHPRLTDIIQLSGETSSRTDGGEVMSRKLFKAGLMMRCMQSGELHPTSIVLFEQMALSLEAINKPLSALPYFQKTAELTKLIYGPFSPPSIYSTIALCCSLRGLSREEEALSIIKKIMLKIRQQTLGIDERSSAGVVKQQEAPGRNDEKFPPFYYGLIVLGFADIVMSSTSEAMKKEVPKARKLLHEVLKLMHSRKVENPQGTNDWDGAIISSVLFKLGTLCEDSGDFYRAKKYYSSASTSFAEVGDMYHLCSILSLVRLSACEVNLGEMEDSKHLLEAASEALDDVVLNGSPASYPGVSRQGVFSVVDMTLDSRFYCLLFRIMEWLGLVLPSAAADMKEAVDKLLEVALKNGNEVYGAP